MLYETRATGKHPLEVTRAPCFWTDLHTLAGGSRYFSAVARACVVLPVMKSVCYLTADGTHTLKGRMSLFTKWRIGSAIAF